MLKKGGVRIDKDMMAWGDGGGFAKFHKRNIKLKDILLLFGLKSLKHPFFHFDQLIFIIKIDCSHQLSLHDQTQRHLTYHSTIIINIKCNKS